MIKSVTSWSEIPQKIKNKLRDANIYYSMEYERIELQKGKTPIYLYDNKYLLVVFVKKKLFFKYASVPTEYYEYSNDYIEDVECFLNESMDILKNKYNIQWVGSTENQAMFDTTPADCVWIPFGSHVIDLSLETEQLWSNLHSKHRNVIRKAQRDGLTIKKGNSKELLKEYLKLDEETWKRSNSVSNTEQLAKSMLENAPENTTIYIIYRENIAQGGAIFFWNTCRSYYIFGASIDKPSAGAMNALHWQAIQDMKANGVREYSFVGCRINEDVDSKIHTIQRFKERFGGPVRRGFMFKCIFNKSLYRIYCSLKYIKENKGKKYPLDIIDQELPKWKDE